MRRGRLGGIYAETHVGYVQSRRRPFGNATIERVRVTLT